jgi:hypothetical protein
MFRGKSAYSDFTRYMTAHEYVVSNNLYTVTEGGRRVINSNAFGKLVQDKVLNNVQAGKFMGMFTRMNSEIDMLKSVQREVNQLSNPDQQSVALGMFKDKMDEIFGFHKTNVSLPDVFYNQAKIFDPSVNDWRTVDARSRSSLSHSLYKTDTAKRGVSRHGFLEARERLKDIVSYMEHGGQYGSPLLTSSETIEIYSLIDRMKVPATGYKGIADMATLISNAVFDKLGAVASANTVEAESLEYRVIDPLKAEAFTREANHVTQRANKYFSSTGILNIRDESIGEALGRIDELVKGKASAISSKVAADTSLGPSAIMEALSGMAETYRKLGISMDVSVSNKSGPGLQLVMYASETATGVVNAGKTNAVDVFIPLIDRDTGLLQVNGVQVTNRFRPIIDKNGMVKLET